MYNPSAVAVSLVTCSFNMNSEKLIECVREYTFLYDLNDRKYSDNQLKDDTWKEIGKKLQVHGKYFFNISTS